MTIHSAYYMLNSSDRFIWKVVCNDLDVRNSSLSAEIAEAIRNTNEAITTLWLLGAPGCGKTTQMHRTAVDFATNNHPVILINALDLDEETNPADHYEYLRLIHYLHNASVEGENKPLLVFIDNPAARIETVGKLLSRFDGLDETFRCIFLLFEREVRYRQAEEEHLLLDLTGSNTTKIYVDSRNMGFKEEVFESFAQALSLPPSEADLAREAFLHDPQISVAEAIINFCKRTHNEEYRKILMDWVDYERVARQQQWGSLADLYKWVSPLYQFGIALPVSLLGKVLDNFNENEFYNLQDFFNNEEYENLPIIIEGHTLRTRHELISQWHVEEELGRSVRQRLRAILKAIDFEEPLERSVFIALLGRKDTVKRYFANLDTRDLEALQQQAAHHPVTHRIAMMMSG